MSARAQIIVPANIRDELLRLKLRVAAEIGRNMTMGEILGLLAILGNANIQNLINLARDSA